MTTFFYLLAVVFIYYELLQFYNAKRLCKLISLFKRDKGIVKRLTTEGKLNFVLYYFMGLMYMFWLLTGLISSQWKLFLLILVMGFIPKAKFGYVWVKVDSAITVGILIFIMLNKYHLHIV